MGLSDGIDALLRRTPGTHYPQGIRRRLLSAMRPGSVPSVQGSDSTAVVFATLLDRYQAASDYANAGMTGAMPFPGADYIQYGGLGVSSIENSEPLPFSGSGPDSGQPLTLPIAADVWYLFRAQTITPIYSADGQVDENATLRREPYILEQLNRAVANVKPLRIPGPEVATGFNNGRLTIKTIRYELWNTLQSMRFPGHPTDLDLGGDHRNINHFCCYIAVPVGPLGVMQTVSIVASEMTDGMRSSGEWMDDGKVENGMPGGNGWGGLFPHWIPSSDNTCFGIPIIKSMYSTNHARTEYPASLFYGFDPQPAHQWIRYYIKRDDVWPVPGTFIFALAKPAPVHCWWYQETSPFAFAGNYFESDHYTSGVVEEVVSPSTVPDEIAQVLKVNICGESFYVRASDWYPYEVGERVAVLKTIQPSSLSFSWDLACDIVAEADRLAATPKTTEFLIHEGFKVVPVSFYEVQT